MLEQAFGDDPAGVEAGGEVGIGGDLAGGAEVTVLLVGGEDGVEETPFAFEEVDEGGAAV